MNGPTLLRCYCCGEPIDGGEIALVTMSPFAVDRVFVASPDHAQENFDEETTHVTLVVRAPAPTDVIPPEVEAWLNGRGLIAVTRKEWDGLKNEAARLRLKENG